MMPPSPIISDEALLAWRSFLRAHSTITRQLDAELSAEHDLTLNDYDVLVQLRDAPDGRMRMSDLARHVLLTRSGITRLVDGLVRDGLVRRVACDADARVCYAEITETGITKMQSARQTHIAGVRRVFSERFDDGELEQLAHLLGRLPGVDAGAAQEQEPVRSADY